MEVRVFYDFKEEPLVLRGEASEEDSLMLRVLPYRLELYVNGQLIDEEWPCGNLLRIETEPAQLKEKLTVVTTEDPAADPLNQPAVIGTLTDAEGWMPGNGVFVGDCMPYTDAGRYHVLYLKDRHHHHSKWGKGAHQWEHLSTTDFKEWQMHPMAVAIDEAWEGSICTGSFISDGDRKYLFYTVRTADGSPAPLRRSVSEDGYHFVKDRDFSFTLSSRYNAVRARDPKVVKAADGTFHMFMTSSELESGKGVLVHLTSADLLHWTEESEPIYRSSDESEPECPDYFYYNGYYYLIFSHRGKGQYRYSKEPFIGWQTPAVPEIPCESVPKAAIYHDRIVFSGFHRIEGYAGTLTLKEAGSAASGEMIFTE